jgi:two-component system chemotaxis sensor kinase CheA
MTSTTQSDSAFPPSVFASGGAMPAAGRQVLLVDDSRMTRELLRDLLERAGHRVVEVADADEALRALKARHFDFVVSDVQMPRRDGVELVRAIRGDPAFARLPVVLVTSSISPAGRQRGLEAGADAYISKGSFDPADLPALARRLA